jgi:SAM-dependent methyltransferase
MTPSVSQRHLAAVLNTLLQSGCFPAKLRILDRGCGDARLLAYMAQELPARNPSRQFEFYGFEVGDIGWHGDGYQAQTAEFLQKHAPGRHWRDRIAVFSAAAPWPYEPASFDVIVSSQVFEHMRDHAFVLREIRRCLAHGGVSVHLFPLHETIYEVHARMPIVHWVSDPAARARLMLRFAHLGLKRKYREERHFRGWENLEEFAVTYSQVLETMTNYQSAKQIVNLADAAGFQADFSYTKDFYTEKLLCKLGRNRQRCGAKSFLDRAAFPLLKRLASVTLILSPSGSTAA